jgi:hypothetical protein
MGPRRCPRIRPQRPRRRRSSSVAPHAASAPYWRAGCTVPPLDRVLVPAGSDGDAKHQVAAARLADMAPRPVEGIFQRETHARGRDALLRGECSVRRIALALRRFLTSSATLRPTRPARRASWSAWYRTEWCRLMVAEAKPRSFKRLSHVSLQSFEAALPVHFPTFVSAAPCSSLRSVRAENVPACVEGRPAFGVALGTVVAWAGGDDYVAGTVCRTISHVRLLTWNATAASGMKSTRARMSGGGLNLPSE